MKNKTFGKICRGCGKKIHIYSTSCPYCGQIQSTFRSQPTSTIKTNINKKKG